MITFYAYEPSKREYCKCEFINMIFAMYGWLSLVSSHEFKFRLIDKSIYHKVKRKERKTPLFLFEASDKPVGYYTVKQ